MAVKRKIQKPLVAWPTSDVACANLRAEIGPTIGLSFSTGKDAVGAWIQLRRYFSDIRPFFRETVPGLRFVNDTLAYYEDFFGAKIIRIPCQWFWTTVSSHAFFPSIEMCQAIDTMSVLRTNSISVRTDAAAGGGWIAEGRRATDSLGRAMELKRNGPLNRVTKVFQPVGDWNDTRLEAEIEAAGVKLPIDYAWFGRSFDSIRARFLGPIKRHAPDDYERILWYFPLAEAELLRYKLSTGEDAADSF